MSILRTIATASLAIFTLLFTAILIRSFLNRKRSSLKWILLLLLLMMGNFLALYPLNLPTANPTEEGKPDAFNRTRGFPVVVITGQVLSGNSFTDTDWGYSWGNLLEQEMGSCYFADVHEIDDALENADLTILTRSACREISQDGASILEEWVRSGGLALLEYPGDVLSGLSGLIPDKGKEWDAAKITDIKTQNSQIWTDMFDLPLCTSCIRIAEKDEDCTTLLEIDERPAVTRNEFGSGVVLAFLFDVGRELVALQQGVPDSGFKVFDKRGSEGVVDATDLLFSPRMINSTTPFADLLERWIMTLIEEHIVIPRIWYFPFRWDGIVTMTHDEDWYGDDSIFVSQRENTKGYNSTFFVISTGPITERGISQIAGMGTEIQIHWNRETSRWMIVFRREDGSLKSQINLLEKKMGGESKVSLCRLERVRWGEHYTMPFRIMEAQEIKVDSSFGSAGKKGKGYLHSTGLLFHPIDSNGMPFELYELPFQIQAQYSGINRSFIKGLLKESQQSYHQIINALYHPHDLEDGKPPRQDWLQFDQIADMHNHGMFTMSEILNWWEMRLETIIRYYYWDGEIFRATFDVPISGIGLYFPKDYKTLQLGELTIDGKVPVNREISLHGKEYILIRAESGSNEIQVVYQNQG